MSKFFTYEELRKNFPALHKVVEARNKLYQHLEVKGYPNAVLYGSSVWSLNHSLGSRHSRRSDIDIAVFKPHEDFSRDDVASESNLADICSGVPASTGVSVDLAVIGAHDYMDDVNPSTADHFDLLARNMPGKSFTGFREYITVSTKDRMEDFERYRDLAKCYIQGMMNVGRGWRDPNPENLQFLSKIENLPDHFARKLLGMAGALPCPDSKDNVRKALMAHPYQGPLRDFVRPIFGKLFRLSDSYERLIDATREGMSEKRFYKEFSTIALEMVHTSWRMLSVFMPENLKENMDEPCPEEDVNRLVDMIHSDIKDFF